MSSQKKERAVLSVGIWEDLERRQWNPKSSNSFPFYILFFEFQGFVIF